MSAAGFCSPCVQLPKYFKAPYPVCLGELEKVLMIKVSMWFRGCSSWNLTRDNSLTENDVK